MARHSGLKIGLLELVGQGLFLPPLMNRVAMSACVEGSAVQWSGHWSVMRSSLWFFAHRRLSQLPHPRALMSSVKRRLWIGDWQRNGAREMMRLMTLPLA